MFYSTFLIFELQNPKKRCFTALQVLNTCSLFLYTCSVFRITCSTKMSITGEVGNMGQGLGHITRYALEVRHLNYNCKAFICHCELLVKF